MIERFYKGGFSADPNQKREKKVVPKERTPDPQEGVCRSFSVEYDISTLANGVYKEVTGTRAIIPAELLQKLTNHLENEFGTLEAEREVKEELIREETKRYIKMFVR